MSAPQRQTSMPQPDIIALARYLARRRVQRLKDQKRKPGK